jgi:iron complex transport system ATP-binding protein
MISLHGVSVELGGTPILSGIDLVVDSGSWTSVIGPNGSGKTTLLRAVAEIVPFTGEVVISGTKPGAVGRKALARMLAYLPQNPVFPPGMKVKDYVLLGRTPYIPYLGTESRRDLTVVAGMLEQVGLEKLAHRRLESLSGGELQRTMLARALAQEAEVLLLDEPTSGMDIGHQQQALELIDSLRAERVLTVLCAIHDLTLAGQFSDQLLLIDSGRACALGAPRAVLTAELIGAHYGAAVRIVEDLDGGIAVVPLRAGAPLSEGVGTAGARTGIDS